MLSEQEFLKNIETILLKGAKQTSYKFAFLWALVKLAQEAEDGTFSYERIAEEVIALYWPHVQKMECEQGKRLLSQGSRGTTILILDRVEALQERYPLLEEALKSQQASEVVGEVAKVIQESPAKRLQIIRGEPENSFLYAWEKNLETLKLKPEAFKYLKKYGDHIIRQSRELWLDFILKKNPDLQISPEELQKQFFPQFFLSA